MRDPIIAVCLAAAALATIPFTGAQAMPLAGDLERAARQTTVLEKLPVHAGGALMRAAAIMSHVRFGTVITMSHPG